MMIDNQPRIIVPVIFALLASATAVARQHSDIPQWGRDLLFLITLIFGAAALFTLTEWLVQRANHQLWQTRSALQITPQAHLLSTIARMNRDQIEYASKHATPGVVIVRPGLQGALSYLEIGDDRIPMAYVAEVLDGVSDELELVPVRSTSDGSSYRHWLKTLTDYLVSQGLAEEARGNRPARLRSWDHAARALGLEG